MIIRQKISQHQSEGIRRQYCQALAPNPKPQTLSSQTERGQQEEGHGVVHHVQGEHHQTYVLHQYQNASIQGRHIRFSAGRT